MLFLTLLLFLFQTQLPLKPSKEFEVITNYELRRKPDAESPKIVFDLPEEQKKSTGTDMLPYLSLKIKIKKWAVDVAQIKIVDDKGKTYLKKKQSDDASYELDMGYVDDMKDNVSPRKFTVMFIREKKPIEQITIEVEEDGTFLINGEKRGKF